MPAPASHLAPTLATTPDVDDLLRLRALVGGLPSGILVEDEQGQIVLVNERFLHDFGIDASPADLLGTPCAGLAAQVGGVLADPAAFGARIGEVLTARVPVHRELVAFADGRAFERDYLPLFLGEDYRGHVWAYRDVSDRIRAEAEAAAARDVAEQAARAKAEFLATVSHEIRTPLNGVLATAELLQSGRLDAEQRDLLEVLQDSARTLHQLLNDVLDLSRMEAGGVEPERRTIDPAHVVRRVAGLMRQAAEGKGVALEVAVDADVPSYVVADEQRLQRILMNLVANAVKFTDHGEVRVHVGVRGPELRHPTLVVEVADTGIGIAPEKVDQLFEPFVQADASTSRRYGGSGLGLAIVRGLAGVLGATVDVRSEPGRGSTFTLAVPVEVDTSAMPASAEVRAARLPQARLAGRVLVVEDNAVNRGVVLRQLAAVGVDADAVPDGYQALEAVRTTEYDVVLMDCQMPELDGFETTRRLRAWEAAEGRARMPIVALTANAMPGDAEACLASDMDGHMAKPVTLAELRRVVAGHLPQPAPAAVDDDGRHPAIDESVLGELEADLGPVTELLEIYLAELPRRHHSIVKAMQERSDAAVLRATHELVGASKVFGIRALSVAIDELEAAVRGRGAASAHLELERVSDEVVRVGVELGLRVRRARGDGGQATASSR